MLFRSDWQPYKNDNFTDNVILTETEHLTMESRPKNPKHARNKNVLVIGGSGSGKTRFWVKPNLLQMHSSYVVTDPKGTYCQGGQGRKNIFVKCDEKGLTNLFTYDTMDSGVVCSQPQISRIWKRSKPIW